MATSAPATTTDRSAAPVVTNDGEGRLIDPRGQRFGAGLSVVVLIAGFALGWTVVLPALMVALGASALFGTRYSVLGRPWPYVRSALRLAPPSELEHEFPPRFAQALGAVGFAVATVLFLAGLSSLAWIVAAAVGALQAVLAVSGYCLGCRLYFMKWWVPAQFQRLARRTTPTSRPLIT
jgi:hypothetical protein